MGGKALVWLFFSLQLESVGRVEVALHRPAQVAANTIELIPTTTTTIAALLVVVGKDGVWGGLWGRLPLAQHPHTTLVTQLRLGHLLVTTSAASPLLIHPKHVVAKCVGHWLSHQGWIKTIALAQH